VLFTDKVNIICEQNLSSKEMVQRVVSLFEKIKMRNVFMDSAEQHDKHIAYVSHLSHISSFMLGKTVLEIEPDEENIFNMAGSGFRSTVRLAKSSPAMWTPIFLQNRDNVLKSLTEYIKNLETFKQLIADGSSDEVYDVMHKTNRIKNILDEKEEKYQREKSIKYSPHSVLCRQGMPYAYTRGDEGSREIWL